MSITAAQLRAARGLIGWSQGDLAGAANVSRSTIADFELGKREPYARILHDLRSAFEAAGVIFVEENGEGAGVRLRKMHKTPADVTRAMAEKTEEFLNREEVVAQANIQAIEERAEKHAVGVHAAGAERRAAARALAEQRLDKQLDEVDAPADEKERRKAALTKPPRRGPK